MCVLAYLLMTLSKQTAFLFPDLQTLLGLWSNLFEGKSTERGTLFSVSPGPWQQHGWKDREKEKEREEKTKWERSWPLPQKDTKQFFLLLLLSRKQDVLILIWNLLTPHPEALQRHLTGSWRESWFSGHVTGFLLYRFNRINSALKKVLC